MHNNYSKKNNNSECLCAVIYNRATKKCFIDYKFNELNRNESFLTTVLGVFTCQIIAMETLHELNKPKNLKEIDKRLGLTQKFTASDKRQEIIDNELDSTLINSKILKQNMIKGLKETPKSLDNTLNVSQQVIPFADRKFISQGFIQLSKDLLTDNINNNSTDNKVNEEEFDESDIVEEIHYGGPFIGVEIVTGDNCKSFFQGNITKVVLVLTPNNLEEMEVDEID